MQPDDYDEMYSQQDYDPEAPYGRRPDGKPYTISPEERARRGAQLAAGRAAKKGTKKTGPSMAPPPLTAANMAAASAAGSGGKSVIQRRAAVENFLGLPIGLLAGIGKVWEPAMLDAMTLTVQAGPIAHSAAMAAEHNETLAKWIDKVTASSPYIPLAMSAVGLLAQVAVNHGLMQPNRQLGSMSVDDMKDQFYATLGAPRPDSDPRRDQVSVPDYPPQDMANAAASA